MQWSLHLVSICKTVDIGFAMLQQSSKPAIPNLEELCNSLLCFIEMSTGMFSFGNNLPTRFNLYTDVTELGSRNQRAHQPPTGHPGAPNLSPGRGPAALSGLLDALNRPRHACAGEGAQTTLGPTPPAAVIQISQLSPLAYFSSRICSGCPRNPKS